LDNSKYVLQYSCFLIDATLSEKGKSKGEIHPRTGREGKGGLALHLTSALDGVSGQRHTSDVLLFKETWYQLHMRLGEGDPRRRVKILPPTDT
jgi:hypothetical protein